VLWAAGWGKPAKMPRLNGGARPQHSNTADRPSGQLLCLKKTVGSAGCCKAVHDESADIFRAGVAASPASRRTAGLRVGLVEFCRNMLLAGLGPVRAGTVTQKLRAGLAGARARGRSSAGGTRFGSIGNTQVLRKRRARRCPYLYEVGFAVADGAGAEKRRGDLGGESGGPPHSKPRENGTRPSGGFNGMEGTALVDGPAHGRPSGMMHGRNIQWEQKSRWPGEDRRGRLADAVRGDALARGAHRASRGGRVGPRHARSLPKTRCLRTAKAAGSGPGTSRAGDPDRRTDPRSEPAESRLQSFFLTPAGLSLYSALR